VLRTVILTEGGRPLGIVALLPLADDGVFPAAAHRRRTQPHIFGALWDGGGAGPGGATRPRFRNLLTATLAPISAAVLLVLPLSLPLHPILQRLGHGKVADSRSAYFCKLLA